MCTRGTPGACRLAAGEEDVGVGHVARLADTCCTAAGFGGAGVQDALGFYATHDEITDPGPHAPRLDDLPDGLPGLHAAINGLLLHVWKAHAWYGHLLTPPPRKLPIRHTARLLDELLRLEAAPLSRARPVDRRGLGGAPPAARSRSPR